MARPKKAPNLKRDAPLHIPMTADEKQLIVDAASAGGRSEFTGWARDILLDAAQKQMTRARKAGSEAKP
jgi:uncharacterized protein (DUF1778 family)